MAADQYGTRDELLRRADLLLSDAAMRGLVAACEAQLDEAITHQGEVPQRLNWPAAKASTALSLLSKALRDPDVLVRSVLLRDPTPNPGQRARHAEAFLKYGQPEGALSRLKGSWEHLERTREHLEAQALTALGRISEASGMRRRIFEASLAVGDLHGWLDLLPPPEQIQAIELARHLAAAHSDSVVVALLLDIGDDAAAEAALTNAPTAIQGSDYSTLVRLVETLERKGLWAGATAVNRPLLTAILDRTYAPACRHAARYWARLEALALKHFDLMKLEPPEVFEARMRAKHKRKTSFWAHVNGERQFEDTEPEPETQVDRSGASLRSNGPSRPSFGQRHPGARLQLGSFETAVRGYQLSAIMRRPQLWQILRRSAREAAQTRAIFGAAALHWP